MGEMLEEDDTLAAETTSEEDKDTTGNKGGTWTCGFDGFADLMRDIC